MTKQVKNIWSWLNGKKTIIGLLLMATWGFLATKNVFDEATYNYLMSITSFITGVGFGHKGQKEYKRIKERRNQT